MKNNIMRTGMRSNKKAVSDMSRYIITENIKNTWLATSGLIPTYLAAMMLNVSMPRINQIWKERNLPKYSFEDGKRDLLSFADVLKIHEERQKVFKKFCHYDEENGVTAEIKVLERKSRDAKEAKMVALEAIEELKYILEKELGYR